MLEYAIAVGLALNYMLATLEHIEALLREIEAATCGVHTAISVDDITYGVVLGSDG